MIATRRRGDGLMALQRRFLAQMRGGDASGEVGGLLASGRMPVALGLGIYGHAYGARLREALDNDHPVLGTYLGDELWERMCAGYIASHPSRVRSLRDFGAGLPDYLAFAEPFSAHPQLAELARFERCLLDGFDAADRSRLDWGQLLALPQAAWPGLRLQFHPSVHRYRTGFNTVETWQAIKAAQAPPLAVPVEARWALWRDEDRVGRFRSLDGSQDLALGHFLQGGDFAGLCEALLADLPAAEVPAVAVGYLQSWCEDGWLSQLC